MSIFNRVSVKKNIRSFLIEYNFGEHKLIMTHKQKPIRFEMRLKMRIYKSNKGEYKENGLKENINRIR